MTREEAIKYADNLHEKILFRFADKVSEKEMQSFCMAILALKQPERAHAHWKCKKSLMYCSKCACGFNRAHRLDYKYCPNCCAIMDEVK